MPAISDPTSSEGVRQRQRQATSALIERVALEMFTASGFDAVTADDIAAKADVARRTVFRYFPGGKEEIVLRDMRRRTEDLRTAMEARPPQESALVALQESLMSLVGAYEEDYEAMQMRATILEGAPSVQARAWGEQMRLTGSLTRLVALRLAADPETDLRPAIIVTATLTAMNVAFGSWVAPGNNRKLRDLLSETLDLINGGLAEIGTRTSPALTPAATGRSRR
jgi:AcrR family transcriptional regulator